MVPRYAINAMFPLVDPTLYLFRVFFPNTFYPAQDVEIVAIEIIFTSTIVLLVSVAAVGAIVLRFIQPYHHHTII